MESPLFGEYCQELIPPLREIDDAKRLVATLGSRSITRRLNRKAILDVDVPEACKVIINPEAPMALRLQGSLL